MMDTRDAVCQMTLPITLLQTTTRGLKPVKIIKKGKRQRSRNKGLFLE